MISHILRHKMTTGRLFTVELLNLRILIAGTLRNKGYGILTGQRRFG